MPVRHAVGLASIPTNAILGGSAFLLLLRDPPVTCRGRVTGVSRLRDRSSERFKGERESSSLLDIALALAS